MKRIGMFALGIIMLPFVAFMVLTAQPLHKVPPPSTHGTVVLMNNLTHLFKVIGFVILALVFWIFYEALF